MSKRFARAAIVVRTQNRPLMLERAINDILAQTFDDWVVVVVNDGGDVNAFRNVLVRHSAHLRSRLVALSNPVPLGMQAASNQGIQACDSDFIAIHDDDDTWDHDFLARTVAHMDRQASNPLVGGVITWSHVVTEEVIDDVHVVELDRFIFNDCQCEVDLVALGIENQFPPISFLFRRSTLGLVGDFQQSFDVLGDWDFHIRFAAEYQIDVIPEPLARYHHRLNGTLGPYGNSVFTQRDAHAAMRVHLINTYIRDQGSQKKDMIAQVLMQGQIHRLARSEQRALSKQLTEKFDHLEDWLTKEQMKIAPGHVANAPLVENGDFCRWPGPGEIFHANYSSHGIVCPGFLVGFDGKEVTYRLERRTAKSELGAVPGQTYLRLENRGGAVSSGSFYLECIIPEVEAMAGQTITISGLGRISAESPWLSIGGRFDLVDGTKFRFSNATARLSEQFGPWSCALSCPKLRLAQVGGAIGRLQLRLDYSKPFMFDVTNVQVRVGEAETQSGLGSGGEKLPFHMKHLLRLPYALLKRHWSSH